MGTTAFVGRRYKGEVEGFSMSGNGYYSGVGLDVIKKYRELTNVELIDFLVNRVTYLDPEKMSDEEQKRLEDMWENMYEIWEIDWKKDSMEIENSDSLTGRGVFSREYGYLFDLDNDTVEVYNQGDLNDNLEWIDGPHKLMFTITRDNIDKVHKLLEHHYAIGNYLGYDVYETEFFKIPDDAIDAFVEEAKVKLQEYNENRRSRY